MIPHFRMDAVGKINRNGALGQVDNVALRSKHKYFIREYIQLQRIHKFLRIGCILPFQNTPEPADLGIEILGIGVLPFLIAPVCRHAVF